jgi:hypothetical protein
VSHIWQITRPGSQFDWVQGRDPLDRRIVRRDPPRLRSLNRRFSLIIEGGDDD